MLKIKAYTFEGGEHCPACTKIDLGINKDQVKAMQRLVDSLERQNDAIGLTKVRHKINQRIIEIRLLLRDGHMRNINGRPARKAMEEKLHDDYAKAIRGIAANL